MGLFFKKDETKSKTHKIVTGLIIGGAVGSVLGTYALRKKKAESSANDNLESPSQEIEGNTDDPAIDLTQIESVEKMVAKKATRPIRRGLKTIIKIVWMIFKSIWRVLSRLERR